MNPFAFRKNRKYALAAAVVIVAGAATNRAAAALDPFSQPQTHLGAYEYVIDPDHRNEHTNIAQSVFGTGPLQYHYSTTSPQLTSVNNAAYVDPATGVMRAYAFSDATVLGTVGVEPPFTSAGAPDRSAAGANVSYRKQVAVSAGSTGLADGTPVQLSLTFHLDGWLHIGGILKHDPGPMYSMASMSADFTVSDPAVNNGEGIYQLANFSASAKRTQTVYVPTGDGVYPDGAQYVTKDYKWSLSTNDPNDPGHNYHDQNDEVRGYNFGESSGTTVPPVYVPDFNTGVLTVTFDTYVGAVLDVDASLGVETASDALSESPYASANFMNTFDLKFTPAAGFEGLNVVSNAVAPEPGTLGLVGVAGLPLLARRRRRRPR